MPEFALRGTDFYPPEIETSTTGEPERDTDVSKLDPHPAVATVSPTAAVPRPISAIRSRTSTKLQKSSG